MFIFSFGNVFSNFRLSRRDEVTRPENVVNLTELKRAADWARLLRVGNDRARRTG